MNKVVENYVLIEVIGSGQYGKVYRGKNLNTEQVVAIKVVKQEKFREVPKLHEFTLNEIQTLSKLDNPNCVKFIEMLKTLNNMYLIYEFCNGGTLEQAIHKKKYLSEGESVKILAQLLNAFKAMIKENILHRDLKPSNILYHNNVIKIADFGFCKSLLSPQDMTATMVGSPIYMAPEVLKGMPYNTKADVWSMGVVFFECLFGYCPYEDQSIAKLITQIDNKEFQIPRYINSISKKAEELLRAMLVVDHRKRIDWTQLIQLTEDIFHIQIGSAYMNNTYLPQQPQQPANALTSSAHTQPQPLLNKKHSSSNLGINVSPAPSSSQQAAFGKQQPPNTGLGLSSNGLAFGNSSGTSTNGLFSNNLGQQPNQNSVTNLNTNSTNCTSGTSSVPSNNQQIITQATNGITTPAPSQNYMSNSQKNTLGAFLVHNSQSNQVGQNGISPLSNNKDILNIMSSLSVNPTNQTINSNASATTAPSQASTNYFGLPGGQQSGAQSNLTNTVNNVLQFNTLGGNNFNGSNLISQPASVSSEDKTRLAMNMRVLVKERNKFIFLSNILSTIFEFNLSINTPVIAFLVTKQISIYAEQLRGVANNLKVSHLAKRIDRVDQFEASNEMKKYKGILTRELNQIQNIVEHFKTEILKLVKTSPHFSDSSQLKAELASSQIVDNDYYQRSLFSYIDEVFTKAKELNITLQQTSINTPQYNQLQADTKQALLHVNEMLDTLMIEEFFDKLIEINCKYSEQSYFENVKRYKPDSLQELVAHKFDYIQSKMQPQIEV